MHKKIYLMGLLLAFAFAMNAQQTAPDYAKKLGKLYKESVPLMQPADLDALMDGGEKVYVLDTRAPREYEVSHIPGAKFVDYDAFKKKDVEGIPTGSKVVVYCSVGYRSERIGEKLQKLGYKDVYNLYGGIFEWKNQGHPVVDSEGKETEQVHTYNENWGQWLLKGEKVYK